MRKHNYNSNILLFGLLSPRHNCCVVKLYKTVKPRKMQIGNCIMFSILSYLIFIIQLRLGSVCVKNQLNHKICTEKHPVVQRFILIVCNCVTIMFNILHKLSV